MNRLFISTVLVAITALASIAHAGGEGEESTGKRFGPFEALTFDSSILRDVKYVAEEKNVYLQLLPDHKDKELIVKLSNGYFSGYREWAHGGYELVSPANQGKPPYAWTDFVNTSATYIEYWMDGEVFLHLKRVE
ncbi:hypothetical protein VDG1235_2655 [Verrucomicrobiia bacterium DG1235]|nr:hypothetical protein VDG1235_2655 [Verrucomicrobiae bacterium DG1235]